MKDQLFISPKYLGKLAVELLDSAAYPLAMLTFFSRIELGCIEDFTQKKAKFASNIIIRNFMAL